MPCNFQTISEDIIPVCDNVIPGIDDVMYAIPLDFIDKANCVFDVSNPLIITDVVLRADASPLMYKAFKITGVGGSNKANSAYSAGTYKGAFIHNTDFIIFDKGPDASKSVVEYANTCFVIIYKNKFNNRTKAGTPSDSLWQMIGYDNGLYLTEANDSTAEALGGWVLKAASKGDAKESYPALTVFKTSAAVTQTMIEALYL